MWRDKAPLRKNHGTMKTWINSSDERKKIKPSYIYTYLLVGIQPPFLTLTEHNRNRKRYGPDIDTRLRKRLNFNVNRATIIRTTFLSNLV